LISKYTIWQPWSKPIRQQMSAIGFKFWNYEKCPIEEKPSKSIIPPSISFSEVHRSINCTVSIWHTWNRTARTKHFGKIFKTNGTDCVPHSLTYIT
jgi:hypothetical protein